MSAAVTFAEKFSVAAPFFIAAGTIVLGSLIGDRTQKRVIDALTQLFDDIKAAGGEVDGLPQARRDHFQNIAAWAAEVGVTFAGFSGLVVAILLLLRNVPTVKATDSDILFYITVVVLFASVAALTLACLDKPQGPRPKRSMTWYQWTLCLSNVVIGAAVLYLD